MDQPINIFWFRRDLRLRDNAGLYYALKEGLPVLPVFIFDRYILDKLEDPADSRVDFIHQSVTMLQQQLAAHHSSIEVHFGFPEEVFGKLVTRYAVSKVFTNHDYEPYARERDEAVGKLLQAAGASLHTYKDQVIFDKEEIMKDDRSPYVVFTPYSRKWRATLNEFYLHSYPTEKYFSALHRQYQPNMPSLQSMNFTKGRYEIPAAEPSAEIIQKYKQQRDHPGLNGTSRLGLHLRFGTISIRELARFSMDLSDTYVNELIWRDFYQMILWHYPQVGKGRAFRREFENIPWRNDEREFAIWCEGQTGYPLVDAGMRQLNQTGFMHNRVRMVTASFLSKHLLIDWRWGEAYFAQKLLDYDLASNNGGWQWAAGSGCDAAPYFRVFNPTLQAKKFDPGFAYIRRWVPEFEDFGYPAPVVEHEFARKRCLEVYAKALKRTL